MVLLILTDVRIVYTFSWKYTIVLSSLCLYLFGLRVPSDSKSGSSSEKYSKGTHVGAYVKNLAFRNSGQLYTWSCALKKNFSGREGGREGGGGSDLSRTAYMWFKKKFDLYPENWVLALVEFNNFLGITIELEIDWTYYQTRCQTWEKRRFVWDHCSLGVGNPMGAVL